MARRGRPPLNPDRSKPVALDIKLPTLLQQRLARVAKDGKLSRAKVVRNLLEEHLPPAPDLEEPAAVQPPAPPKLPKGSIWPELDPYEAEEPPPAYDPITGVYRFPGGD